MYRKEKLLENRDFIIIGENIRRLRRSKNYIQEYLAEKLHISANHVYRIENAEAHISMPLLLKIKHLFEVDANELLEDHDNGEKEILSHNHHFKWWFGLALIRADYMRAQKGGYRKRCHWSAYKAVLLESSFLDSSACSLIYFFIASSVILPIVET